MLKVLQDPTAKMVLLHYTIADPKRTNESCTLYGNILILGPVIKSEVQTDASTGAQYGQLSMPITVQKKKMGFLGLGSNFSDFSSILNLGK